jgi:hypothetical protein
MEQLSVHLGFQLANLQAEWRLLYAEAFGRSRKTLLFRDSSATAMKYWRRRNSIGYMLPNHL